MNSSGAVVENHHSDTYKSACVILDFGGLPRLPPLLVDPLPRLAPLAPLAPDDGLRCASPVHANGKVVKFIEELNTCHVPLLK